MSKEYIETLIKIGELLLENGYIDHELGKKVCGAYWASVEKDMKDNAKIQLTVGGLSVFSREHLTAYLQICRDRLSAEISEEEDRLLDNESKLAAIKANKIAKWAIAISVLAATGLPQRLLQWLCGQASCIFGFQ